MSEAGSGSDVVSMKLRADKKGFVQHCMLLIHQETTMYLMELNSGSPMDQMLMF